MKYAGSTTIYIGNQSVIAGRTIESLAGRFGFDSPLSLMVKDGLEKTQFQDNTLSICRCSHLWFDESYCIMCAKNEDTLQQVYRQLLEGQEGARNLYFCVDVCDPFSVWAHGKILDFLDTAVINPSVGTCLIKQLSQSFGLNSFSAVEGMYAALTRSDFLTIRGLSEYTFDPNSSNHTAVSSSSSTESSNKTPQFDLTVLCKRIACDLFFAVAPHDGAIYGQGEYSLFPCHIASHKNKIIDVRSSLYKSLTRIDSQRAKGVHNCEVHPLRYLSSNLHQLHLSSASRIDSYVKIFNLSSCFGSGVSFKLDSKARELRFMPSYEAVDVKNAMTWAVNSTFSWEVMDTSRFVERKNLPKASVSGDFSTKALEVAVFCMESVYGGAEIHEECMRVRDSMRQTAYKMNLSQTSVSYENIVDKMAYLEDYLQS
eukprot:gene2451-2606_t